MTTNNLVAKIWSFCDTLRDDGVSYSDYVEQLTFLLFLKMADEYSQPPYNREFNIPDRCNWKFLSSHKEDNLTTDYFNLLTKLSEQGGMLGKIFYGAQNKIHDHKKLKKLIELIDEETWVSESVDIKGDIYESLLQKSAESSGAGQYFTPRAVIKAMVECVRPQTKETIWDPSCGTGGFFLGAIEYLNNNFKEELNKRDTKEFFQFDTFKGWEIVPSTARLCLMNLFLHDIGDLIKTPDVNIEDSLINPIDQKTNIVLANPPFGKSSSYYITNDKKMAEQDSYFYRSNFWTTTSNKQLAFVQHIVSMLEEDGRAAIVLPDNILFEGGAGEIIRKKLLEETNLHTILRLPTGIFYANGVKSNVLFLEKKKGSKKPLTKEVWVYDYRTNIHHTLKKQVLKYEHLLPFVECYLSKDRNKTNETWSKDNPNGRLRKYSYNEIILRDKTNFDVFWLKDDSYIDMDSLPEPEILAQEIIDGLDSAVNSFREVVRSLHRN
ncbi:class I SAM-dependent DNA methyltransferase [Pedobacter sp. UBA4863]|uniref:type I restriction-modification system subunit M n=1 Tax=Pedobacter sp. UBA4863 TaxID=1947060 RepID=UPI0025EA9230|nr:class I SAM-dependent DNA methyltransferase [Pedobacter sp. UBA4863]